MAFVSLTAIRRYGIPFQQRAAYAWKRHDLSLPCPSPMTTGNIAGILQHLCRYISGTRCPRLVC